MFVIRRSRSWALAILLCEKYTWALTREWALARETTVIPCNNPPKSDDKNHPILDDSSCGVTQLTVVLNTYVIMML